MKRIWSTQASSSLAAVAITGLATSLTLPDTSHAQQQKKPEPQVRQVAPRVVQPQRQVTQSARQAVQPARREVVKAPRNTASSDSVRKVSPPASTVSKPVSKPVIREAAPKPIINQKPIIRDSASKPVLNKTEPPKTANTRTPVELPKKPLDAAKVDPKKLDPIKRPGDLTKGPILQPIDPAKRTGDLTRIDPSKGPLLPGKVGGPLGPTPSGSNATGRPIGPAGLPGQKTASPIAQPPIRAVSLPARGVNIKPMLVPTRIAAPNQMLWRPAKPPIPAPRLFGPAWYQPAPKFSWYPWGGRKYFPYFFVGTVVTGAVVVAGYNYWTPPPPSCYAGGSTVYYYPGTRVCYDFSVAREDDDFECHGKVFKYRPSRYRTVETMIENEAATAVPVATWQEREPARKVQVQAAIDRAAARAQTIAAVPPEKLDCSACLAALGPTEGEDGQATVSMVNNCDHDITVSGGLTKTGAPADTPAVCEFQGDVPAGQEVVACTKPTSDFAEAQVFLNAVVPVEGTTKPAPACRIPDAPKAN